MSGKNICILGAGLAGLSAAWHLQRRGHACQVFEKEPEPGGLCRSKTVNGFTFDYDGHLLHFRHWDTYALVRDLLKGNLAGHRRNSWVYSCGHFTHYPFQANLYGLPTDIVKECLSGFVKARNNGALNEDRNFLKWIKGTFGDGIAKHFMVPYNTKFWTVPPQRMTSDWLHGFVPEPTLDQLITGTIEESEQLLGYNSHFWYPKHGGIRQLASAFQARLEHVHLGAEVRRIDLKKRVLLFADGTTRPYDQLVSTIPLPELPRIVGHLPREIQRAIRKLRWNSVFNLNFGLQQDAPSDKHWIYFPQKDLSFFRVGCFHNFSTDLVPPGRSSLYVEVAYSGSAPLDRKGIVGRVKRDLKKVGLLGRTDRILATDRNDIRYGYPIYDKNYASARAEILHFLSRHHIVPCGRYGSWRYMSMEDVILDGRDVAQRLLHASTR